MNIAIIGMGPGNEDAPYLDPRWQCWAMLKDPVNKSRAPILFEMHDWCSKEHDGDAEVIHRGNYPLEAIVSGIGRDWFESSIAYMVARAIVLGPSTIGLWGVHMASESEYAHQRPNLLWLLGIAEARGIRVHVPEGCNLLSYTRHEARYPKRYGYQN